MRSLNIAILAQLSGTDAFNKFMQVYSRCTNASQTQLHEQETLKDLVERLSTNEGLQLRQMDHFFFSYSIPQISKEFDLLKIGDKQVINIELKSQPIAEERILKQLKRNQYYLKHLQRETFLFTYIMGGQVYMLGKDENLVETSLTNLAHYIQMVSVNNAPVDINSLFQPSQFLISPLNTPDRFLAGDYFLTDRQQEIKETIIKTINQNKGNTFGFSGNPGTGKTLLLYDIARTLSENHKCLIVHCAPLSNGHTYLSSHMQNCLITTPKDYCRFLADANTYDIVLFDEFHRAKDAVFKCAEELLKKEGKYAIFSFDFGQTLSRAETTSDLLEKLRKIRGMTLFSLSDRIRTNKEISTFIHKMFQPERYKDLKASNYSHVTVLYSDSRVRTESIINDYQAQGFIFINHSTSLYRIDTFDSLERLTHLNSHRVIGQEFDKVLVVINEKFFYENGNLSAYMHANPDYLFTRLLYQEVTRTRNELCIIVENNLPVLSQILSLFRLDD